MGCDGVMVNHGEGQELSLYSRIRILHARSVGRSSSYWCRCGCTSWS